MPFSTSKYPLHHPSTSPDTERLVFRATQLSFQVESAKKCFEQLKADGVIKDWTLDGNEFKVVSK